MFVRGNVANFECLTQYDTNDYLMLMLHYRKGKCSTEWHFMANFVHVPSLYQTWKFHTPYCFFFVEYLIKVIIDFFWNWLKWPKMNPKTFWHSIRRFSAIFNGFCRLKTQKVYGRKHQLFIVLFETKSDVSIWRKVLNWPQKSEQYSPALWYGHENKSALNPERKMKRAKTIIQIFLTLGMTF